MLTVAEIKVTNKGTKKRHKVKRNRKLINLTENNKI